MKKKKKKPKKKSFKLKVKKPKKKSKSKIKKKISKFKRKKFKRSNQRKKIKKVNKKIIPEKGIISRTVRLEEDLKNKLSFKFNFNLLAIDKLIQKFFQSIELKLIRFKEIRAEEKRQIKLEKIFVLIYQLPVN